MGAEGRLSPKNRRKMEAIIGEPLHNAIATHHPWVECITPDDRHYALDRKTGLIVYEEDPIHFTSCPSVVEAESASPPAGA